MILCSFLSPLPPPFPLSFVFLCFIARRAPLIVLEKHIAADQQRQQQQQSSSSTTSSSSASSAASSAAASASSSSSSQLASEIMQRLWRSECMRHILTPLPPSSSSSSSSSSSMAGNSIGTRASTGPVPSPCHAVYGRSIRAWEQYVCQVLICFISLHLMANPYSPSIAAIFPILNTL